MTQPEHGGEAPLHEPQDAPTTSGDDGSVPDEPSAQDPDAAAESAAASGGG